MLKKSRAYNDTGECFLLNFLFQIFKQRVIEKILDRYIQSVTKFFDGGNRCAFIAPTDNIIDCGLRDAADST